MFFFEHGSDGLNGCLFMVFYTFMVIASRRPQAFKGNTDSTDATDLFFHGFFIFYCLGFHAPVGRFDFYGFSLRLEESSAVQAQENQ